MNIHMYDTKNNLIEPRYKPSPKHIFLVCDIVEEQISIYTVLYMHNIFVLVKASYIIIDFILILYITVV